MRRILPVRRRAASISKLQSGKLEKTIGNGPAWGGMHSQQLVQVQGISGDNIRLGKQLAQVVRQQGRHLYSHQAIFRQTFLEERAGDDTRARAEFEHEMVPFRRKPPGHGHGEIPRTRGNGANLAGPIERFL